MRHCGTLTRHTVEARVWDKASNRPVTVTVMVELELDLDALAATLGQKAMKNEGRRSTLINGAIRARVKEQA
jgi:hypothetical protein